ncbi:hypothetical protein D7193_09435 [Micromonospora costi]|uniref:DNRLRE domain-containing protein n=1 Tax=Micromonospora costi TaxID=1530042 RepID=A0A3B0AGF3_9ACTN|nr:hypothetical protein D7193_09435 [Micromonospora costi]
MAVTVATGGALAVPSPVHAYSYSQIPASSWAYTDSSRPHQAVVGAQADAPVGRWLDAEENAHTSRFYFTLDLSSLAGRQLLDVDLVAREKKVTDCTKGASVELWRTAAFTSGNSWKNPPAELERLGTIDAGAGRECSGPLAQDLADAVHAALARGEKALHLELRLSAEAERDRSLSRWLWYRPTLSVQHNGLPTVGALSVYPGRGCGDATHPVAVGRSTTFAAKASDPDQNEWVDVTFAAWPVDQPDQRTERGGGSYGGGQEHRTEWDMSSYPHGTVVAWTARSFDGDGYSDWAAPCYVRVDRQPPAQAPEVSSTDYPAGRDWPGSGGVGVPGTFRLDAGGDTDVTSYRLYDTSTGMDMRVDAPTPGAAAEATWTPRRSGPVRFEVTAVDPVGNASPVRVYEFMVRDTEPEIRVEVAGTRLPSTLTMRSPVTEVTSFGYRVGEGAETRVPASAGAATVELVFPDSATYKLTVAAYVGDQLSGVATDNVLVNDAPTVESADFAFPEHDGVVGREGSFTFRPRTTDVVAYRYSFDYEEPIRVAAAADGTATVPWTPQQANWYTLYVRSERADGSLSAPRSYEFSVIDNRPTVYSGNLVSWPRRDGLGLPIEFSFDTAMPDVTEFVYQFDGEVERTVAAEYGSARVTWTPDRAGERQVTVRSRYASGELSPPAVWPFQVWTGPVVRSTTYDSDSVDGRVGKEATFTFQPGLPDVQRYTYRFDGGDEQSVDAAADGTASVRYTPGLAGYQTLEVTSHGADGTSSQTRTYAFIVKSDKVTVYGYYNEWGINGGIGVPGSMTFWTELFRDVTEYRYQLNDGPEQTLAASTDGTGTTFTLTPDRNGTNTLSVRQVLRNGEVSPATEFSFEVGTAPRVTSAEYPAGSWSGGAGQAGRFTFSGGTAGIVEFEFQVGEDDARTVPAIDGTATVTWTPPYWTGYTMTVRGRLADGTWTDTTSYSFYVAP